MKATPPPDPTAAQPEPPPEPAAPPPEQPPVPEPPAAPTLATWPEWFGAVDFALVLFAVAAAFLATSFAARNSDVWLHLAAGRNAAHGNLGIGADPFSFAGGDRPWVHSSWLFDLLLYAAYSADSTGAVVVGAKAACVAAAFGLVMLLRRPGHALWPWGLCALLGVLAAAPYAQLRPIAISMLFLAATFVLLYRRPWSAAGWRGPGVLAGLFLVWANVDAWALLGPVVVALVLAGEYLNRFLGKDEAADPDDPFPAAPPLPALGKALALGLVAVLVNPTFLAAAVKDPGEAVAQLLPPELGLGIPRDVSDDFELSSLSRSPLDSDYQNQTNLGKNANGVAFGTLLIGGALVLLAGFGRVRATHLLLWVLFAGLAIIHVRLIGLFAVAAVPLVAGHLNGLSLRVRLGPVNQPGTRILLTVSAMGRVLTVLAALALIASTYPGWVHPTVADPAQNIRLDWAVTADPGLVRAAERVNAWRADGRLPQSSRGLNASVDFGNYCAWYAPSEKVFVNGRFAYHRHELPDLLTLRRQVADRKSARDVPPEPPEVWRICEARSADYLVVANINRKVFEFGAFVLLEADERWVPWYLNGRAIVLGRSSDRASAATAAGLRYDPVAEAFAPGAPLLPDGKAAPLPPPKESFLDEYLDRPKPPGLWADEALLLSNYSSLLVARRADMAWQRKMIAVQLGAIVTGPAAAIGWGTLGAGRPVGDAEFALPILVLRAARRAVAEDPDRPEPYRALALAYQQRLVPAGDMPQLAAVGMNEPQAQVIAARARFLARIPDPEKTPTPQALRTVAFQEAFYLAQDYQQTGQLDLRQDAVRRMIAFAGQVPTDDVKAFLGQVVQFPATEDPAKLFDNLKSRLTREVQPQVDAVGMLSSTPQKFGAAQGRGLTALAIKVFLDNPKDFGNRYPEAFLTVIRMELQAGRLEDAAVHLDTIDDKIKDEEKDGKKFEPEFLAAVRQLKSMNYRLEGNYEALGEALNESAPPKQDAVKARAAADLGAVLHGLAAVGGPVVGLSAGNFDRRVTPRLPVLPVDGLAQTRNFLAYESAYQYDRGMAALVRGDLPEAKRRLEFARTPQGVPIAKLGEYDRAARIEVYLMMIARGEAGK